MKDLKDHRYCSQISQIHTVGTCIGMSLRIFKSILRASHNISQRGEAFSCFACVTPKHGVDGLIRLRKHIRINLVNVDSAKRLTVLYMSMYEALHMK